MIINNTVLILGAGSSIPYEFPSGETLKNEICTNLVQPGAKGQLKELGYTNAQIDDFRNALFYSGMNSVDEFLEHRTDLINIGKLAIAQRLIKFEVQDLLFKVESSKNWLTYLFKKMNTTFDDFDKNNISFITFNYDRSLEHFFFVALRSTYNKDLNLTADKVNNLNIVHLHGQLGYLPWQKEGGRAYANLVDVANVKKGAENIKIIHEDIKDDKEFQKAHELLDRAKHIYFLGFGFHPTNMKRLKIWNDGTKLIAGTSIDVTLIEKYKIENNSGNQIRKEYLIDTDIVDFFRKHYELK